MKADMDRKLRDFLGAKTAKSFAEVLGLGPGKLFQPLRVALTGTAVSPGIFEVLMILGRERSLARIEAAVRYLEQHSTA